MQIVFVRISAKKAERLIDEESAQRKGERKMLQHLTMSKTLSVVNKKSTNK